MNTKKQTPYPVLLCVLAASCTSEPPEPAQGNSPASKSPSTETASAPHPSVSADSYATLAGETLYNMNCLGCHQQAGHGKVGFAPDIRNQDFLALATDEFLRQTIRQGRPGTAMVPRLDLAEIQINSIIAYLRSTEEGVNKVDPIEVDWTTRFSDGDAHAGKQKYAQYCASCHGANGEGYLAGTPGPAIGNPGFLVQASDDFIYKTLKYGRRGTPMRKFLGAEGVANLSDQDAHDIIAHLRHKNL